MSEGRAILIRVLKFDEKASNLWNKNTEEWLVGWVEQKNRWLLSCGSLSHSGQVPGMELSILAL